MVPLNPALLLALLPLVLAEPPEPQSKRAKPPSDGPGMDRLLEVLATAKARHVDVVEDPTLYRGAIDGTLRALDPYSSYLTPDAVAQLRNRVDGRYVGIGVEIGVRDGSLTVIAPLAGGPAEAAGILAGDLVIEIDGHRARRLSMSAASELLVGPSGSEVTLTVKTPARDSERCARGEPAPDPAQADGGHIERRPRTVRLVRRRIEIQPVDVRVVLTADGRRIAHARINAFQRDTAKRLGAALTEARPLAGVVLDLRGNPGGLLTAGVRTAALFLERGLIVKAVGRGGSVRAAFAAEDAHLAPEWEWLWSVDLPLITLIDGGSASASEIAAGALRDHGRSRLFGETSFGKGSVQSIVELRDGHAVKLTTARYQLPHGAFVDGVGLTPDVEVAASRALQKALDDLGQAPNGPPGRSGADP